MIRRYLVVGSALLLLTAAACSSSSSSSPKTVSVQVDAKTSSSLVAFLEYFPKQITVHPGDTVNFDEHFSGEPHTVTLGTLVDQGLAKADPNAQAEPPELQKIATLLPQGPGDAVQAVAQPCYLGTGDPPQNDACTKDQQAAQEFTGTQTFVNSGFLTDGQQFKLKLSKDLAPGTYNYFCTLHREGMTGKIVVVAKSTKTQTAAEITQAGEKELSDQLAKLKPTMDAIRTGTLPGFVPTAAAGTAIAGGGSQSVPEAEPTLFGPATVSIKTGQSVTWTVVGPHTISFGASEALRTFISRSPDGSVHLNPDSGAPAGGAGQPQGPPAANTSETSPPVPIDGGSYDGTGFHSSGFIGSFPPPVYTYKLKFTKAGTYSYVCLVHPDMKGVVNVS